MRGLKNCRCSPLDVLAWTGEKRIQTSSTINPFDDQSFSVLSAVRVSAVYARYIHANGAVAEGDIPPVTSAPKYQITLPPSIPHAQWPHLSEPPDSKPHYTTTLWGSHPFKYNDQWHAAYPMGLLIGPDISDVDENSHVPTHVCIVNLETEALVHTYLLPMVDPGTAFPNAYWEFMGDFGPGGHQPNFNPKFWGFSGKTWVASGKYRDGTPWLQRHNFETGSHGLALGSFGLVEGECIIQLPAQAADDGRAWVVGIKGDGADFGIYTGPWENSDVCTNFVSPSGFQAALTPAERVNRVNHKPGDGKTWGSSSVTGVSIVAYTRMHGFDYILILHEQEGEDNECWYYDGRREQWEFAGRENSSVPGGEDNDGWLPDQIYNCEDGSVVLANDARIQYRDADGQIIWNFVDAFGKSIQYRGIKISDNGGWIMVTNVLGARGLHRTTSTADTAAFGTHAFMGNVLDYPLELDTGADWPLNWSFSKQPRDDGEPVVILHREYDTRKWFPYFIGEEPFRTPDPGYKPEDGYTVRVYCGNADIKRGDYTNGPGVNGKQHYMGGPNISTQWALYPGCKCCGIGAEFNQTGY